MLYEGPPTLLKSVCLLQIATIAPDAFVQLGLKDNAGRAVANAVASDVPAISRPAREAKEII